MSDDWSGGWERDWRGVTRYRMPEEASSEIEDDSPGDSRWQTIGVAISALLFLAGVVGECL